MGRSPWADQLSRTSPTGSARRSTSWRPAGSIPRPCRSCKATSFYTSHEALLLALRAGDDAAGSLTGQWYDTSAHMLWIGDRTRFDGQRARRVPARRRQPDRHQVRAEPRARRAAAPARRAQSGARAGRITLISRFGHDKVEAGLPRAGPRGRSAKGRPVVWSCDPMHGNVDQGGQRLQDPAVRPHPRRSARLLRGPPRRGHARRRHPRRDDRPGRDRVHRRRGGDHRRGAGRPLPHPLRSAPERGAGARAGVPAWPKCSISQRASGTSTPPEESSLCRLPSPSRRTRPGRSRCPKPSASGSSPRLTLRSATRLPGG